ncbi:MAG: rod shape-determining protein MreD [Candidatus Omnitrophica bacterium]|nr:rod shape-determining protein MreD [Candidatus Omnitrophota bacterium]MBU4346115.1 rod shape-determining protein MreD [Candidatus Omnitrophota bacterium]MBU4473564.1 rod shape-determining protein MreD [Candidatus Omnitrophota bacterium]MCG2706281.1 rod shape-determining protein MreD [Candidatus Omnitrophota bacterium]
MRKWFFLFIIVVLGLLEVAVLDYFKIFGVKPDLFLIVVVILSLFFELKGVIFFVIFAGVLKDAFSINTFGINTLLLPLWSFLIMKLSKRISIDNNFILMAVIFIITASHNIITGLILVFSGGFFIPLGISLRIAFLESLYTAIIAPLVFKIFRTFPRWLPQGAWNWE